MDHDNDFKNLTPNLVLDSLERIGYKTTGRSFQLNSLENRVFEIEVEESDINRHPFVVVKYYRPNRWSKEQILEEHQFVSDCQKADLNLVAPIPNQLGETVFSLEEKLWYSVWPRKRGRSNPELSLLELEILGRLLGRLHNVGATKDAPHRNRFDPLVLGRSNLNYLMTSGILPDSFKDPYQQVVNQICDIVEPWFKNVTTHRIHGDCHIGNIVWSDEEPYLLDFDDFGVGPAVQDLWLVIPGRDAESQKSLQIMIDAYETFRPFDWESFRLIEPLRALRMINFSAWIAKRSSDPYVQKVFGNFGTNDYWKEQLSDLNDQLNYIYGAR